LPLKPVSIHSFIKKVSLDFYKFFFSKTDFLYVLLSDKNFNFLDDLILIIMGNLKKMGVLSETWLNEFYKTFLLLDKNNYTRVKILLNRLEKMFWLPEQDSNLRPND
jgi:hypothetical protein